MPLSGPLPTAPMERRPLPFGPEIQEQSDHVEQVSDHPAPLASDGVHDLGGQPGGKSTEELEAERAARRRAKKNKKNKERKRQARE